MLKIKILAKRKRELTTKLALERQRTDEVIARLEALAEQSVAKRLLNAGFYFLTMWLQEVAMNQDQAFTNIKKTLN